MQPLQRADSVGRKTTGPDLRPPLGDQGEPGPRRRLRLPSRAWLVGFLLPLPGGLPIGGIYSVAVFVKLAWLAGIFSVRSTRLPHLLWALILYVWCSWLLAVIGEPAGAFESTIGLARWLFDFSFFVIGASLLTNDRALSRFTRGARLGLLIACVYVAYVIVLLGYAPPAQWPELAWGDAKRAIRDYVKDWPNYYGIHLAALLSLFRLRSRPLQRLWREPATAFCLIIALTSVSRSVILLLGLFIFWQALTHSRRPLVLVRNVVLYVSLFAAFLNTPLLWDRVVRQTLNWAEAQGAEGFALDKDVVARFELWSEAWPYITARPIFGYGQRSLAHLSPEVYSTYWGIIVPTGSVHNDFVDMALRAGVPAVILFFWFVIRVSRRLRRLSRATQGETAETFTIASDLILIMIVIGMTGDFYRYEAWISLFWLLAGASYGFTRRLAAERPRTVAA